MPRPVLLPIALLVLCLLTAAGHIASAQTNQNRVISTSYRAASSGSPVTSIQYLDGLGRSLQTVAVKAGSTDPGPMDILTGTQVYDEFGRPYKTIIPAPSANNDGSLVDASSTQTQAQNFYKNDTNPFSLAVYEPSPLNRVTQQFGAGNAWQSANKSVNTQYQTNTLADNVLLWTANGRSLSQSGAYPTGQLYKTTLTNENGNQVVEFKDKEGHTIEKWVQEASGFLITSYVYDDFGRLVAVLQPQLVASNPSVADANNSNLIELL